MAVCNAPQGHKDWHSDHRKMCPRHGEPAFRAAAGGAGTMSAAPAPTASVQAVADQARSLSAADRAALLRELAGSCETDAHGDVAAVVSTHEMQLRMDDFDEQVPDLPEPLRDLPLRTRLEYSEGDGSVGVQFAFGDNISGYMGYPAVGGADVDEDYDVYLDVTVADSDTVYEMRRSASAEDGVLVRVSGDGPRTWLDDPDAADQLAEWARAQCRRAELAESAIRFAAMKTMGEAVAASVFGR